MRKRKDTAVQRATRSLMGRPGVLVLCNGRRMTMLPINASGELMRAYRGPEKPSEPHCTFDPQDAFAIIRRVRDAGLPVAFVFSAI